MSPAASHIPVTSHFCPPLLTSLSTAELQLCELPCKDRPEAGPMLALKQALKFKSRSKLQSTQNRAVLALEARSCFLGPETQGHRKEEVSKEAGSSTHQDKACLCKSKGHFGSRHCPCYWWRLTLNLYLPKSKPILPNFITLVYVHYGRTITSNTRILYS